LRQETGSLVLDRNGVLLRPFPIADGRWRLPATLADVDPLFIQTLIAYEDARFRHHRGVDIERLPVPPCSLCRMGVPYRAALR
jgi:penicillin-binding protein 1C